jgi:cytochrome P450
MTQTETDARGPVVPYEFFGANTPALANFSRMDSYRQIDAPAIRSDEAEGYWVFTDYEAILDGLNQPDLFSNRVIVPTESDPPYKWIPIMLDPPDHTKWRQLLGGYFSPGRIRSMADGQHRFAAELIDRFADRDGCEYLDDFARVFPTSIFLEIMGLPTDELEQFMKWEAMILHTPKTEDPDGSIQLQGMQAVTGYFGEVIARRRAEPIPGAQDIVSNALAWQIDGAPISDTDLLNCCLLLFMAGLDTVASQLSYMMLHLATHPEDRRRLVENPDLTAHAVEEMLRGYPIVQTARKVTRDAEFRGCPLRAGDMAAFPLAIAGRDDRTFPEATHIDFDREDVRHISFGAGPHRCLGSHLARQELQIALTEWHRRIPDYTVVGTPTEHTGGVFGLERLELSWR